MADMNDVALARGGDADAFGRLMAEYSPLMLSLCARFYGDGVYGVGLDDLMQEASIAFYQAVCTYSDSKHTTFGLYAKICMKNALSSYMRKNPALESVVPELEGMQTPSDEQGPLEHVISQEDLRLLKKRIRSLLTEYEHKIFVLNVSGKSAREIAAELGVDEKSVYNAVARVKKKLKRLI